MTNLRIGHGYDAHRFAEGRKLVLGGVEIAHSRGLLGHSDADAAVHALMDALLGAAGLGDIGKLFPPSDPQYEGISSVTLLATVREKLELAGFRPVNADITIIAQEPRLAAYIPEMRAVLTRALGADVSVKATTEEGMGFTGAREGVAAHAVALLERVCDR